MKKEKSKGGRPTKYRKEFCETAIECGKQGMGKAEIAAELGICRDTIRIWAKENKEFSASIKRAYLEALAWWERKGREATFGQVHNFQSTSYIFQMKNRFRDEWRDSHEVKNTSRTELVISQETQDLIINASSAAQDVEAPESFKQNEA